MLQLTDNIPIAKQIMINSQLINPKSIVVIGASSDLRKAGGKMLYNIIAGGYQGDLMVVNKRATQVQGHKSYADINDLPDVELAILAIPAQFCPQAIEELAKYKNTKAFIVISAGFSELNDEGAALEQQMVDNANKYNAALSGPNCIGIINQNYHGVFTTPIPVLDNKKGCDFISSSGATAVFLMEAGMQVGLRFSSIYSVGNGNQICAEDYLQYLDDNFEAQTSSKNIIMYLENILKPQKLLKHAISLIAKGCRIAAIKSGVTDAGSRAASSHTGAMATSDMATRALFRKAGIVYCSSREELISVASVFSYKKLNGKNIAVITHAGGSAVMLTDTLTKGGLQVPLIDGDMAEDLLDYLHKGSSVSNPIDFLATGTAEQLGIIIDFCEHKFDFIDAMVVVFGSPGLFDVENVYKVLNVKMDVCQKPIFPVLPSLVNAAKEIRYFLSKGHVNFPDEVTLGKALCATYFTGNPAKSSQFSPQNLNVDIAKIRQVLDDTTSNDGYLSVAANNIIMDCLDIPRVAETTASTKQQALQIAKDLGFPLVMKVIGPLHKSDVGGVVLDINSAEMVTLHFTRMLAIPAAQGVIIQKQIKGIELFIGVSYEPGFGHLLMMGLGGIFVEVLADIKVCLCPCSKKEIIYRLKNLQGYPLLQGIRGKTGIDLDLFADIILKISHLTQILPEITELDINPLIGMGNNIMVVDMRIKVSGTPV
ncbi:Acetyl-CoA synthetase (ADP-forming) alpha and beta chains, putative [hydrothermal vent metagenome]|uniref:Acetyl-CoA synthetase (ADP-forming) alpha and beta chains, putative n=1 Tax=hydrothermal vent metagenome TaxID=652676 RepID=A0A3B0UR00_9ZZZZ